MVETVENFETPGRYAFGFAAIVAYILLYHRFFGWNQFADGFSA